ncbi:MAG: DNA/RNA nuclease SfsA [Planctomycetota bacterium]|nr:DNA/RNA nuclease SfsA [Planctomycetota bacterium]
MPALDHVYETPVEEGVLIKRYKRFLADVELDDGRALTVHCANPGSMRGCAEPGSRVRIRDSGNAKRKLPHNLEQIRAGRTWVCVNTAVANRVVGSALARDAIAPLAGYTTIRPEVADGAGSRLDFLLEGDRGRCWVEVKSTTLKSGREAQFPDAVTARGLKHLGALAELRAAGDRTVMLYLLGRGDVDTFRPAWTIDPAYAEGLARAHAAGVEIVPVRSIITARGVGAGLILPYDLAHV